MVAGHGLGHGDHRILRHRLTPAAHSLAFGAMRSILGVPDARSPSSFVIVVAAAHIVLTRTPSAVSSMRSATTSRRPGRRASTRDRIIFSVYVICGVCAALGGVMLIALVGRLNQTFGVGKEFDVITAAVLGGTSLFGGVGYAFGAVVGSVLVQMVQAGMVFVKVNLYLQPMVLAGIIFLAVFFDSLRERRVLRLKRRNIRVDEAETRPALTRSGISCATVWSSRQSSTA